MRNTIRILWTGIAIAQLAIVGAQAATLTYQLDNGIISQGLNASEGTEPLDNWFANEFQSTTTNAIVGVQYGLSTAAPNTVADVVLYRQTSLQGYTRIYTQAFTPLTGTNTLQTVFLNTPQKLNVGDDFLVAIFMQNVIGAPPNDKYPYLQDTSGSGAGSWWDRSAPNTFNLDNLSGAALVTQPLTPGGFIPGANHLIIRAFVPEPSVFALAALGATVLAWRRRSARS